MILKKICCKRKKLYFCNKINSYGLLEKENLDVKILVFNDL